MSVVVWDIETQDVIKNMPGFDREEQVRNLEVSCLSYLVLPSDVLLSGSKMDAAAAVEAAPMVTLWRDQDDEGAGPFRELLEAFDRAELIVGYNSLGFDHPVLYKHCDRRRTEKHLFKVHDAFARLRDHTGVWFKLDHLLQINGLATKTADGLQAISWWKEGERALLQEYCEQARIRIPPHMRDLVHKTLHHTTGCQGARAVAHSQPDQAAQDQCRGSQLCIWNRQRPRCAASVRRAAGCRERSGGAQCGTRARA